MKLLYLYKGQPRIKYFSVALLILLITCKGFSQKRNTNTSEWDSLKKLYDSGKLNDTAYLNNAIELAYNTGNFSATKKELALFHKIAFSNNTDKFIGYRAKYFQFLANDAMYSNNDGSCIFYSEKMESEYSKLPGYIPTFTSYRLSIGWFVEWKEPRKGLEKIKEIYSFINSLPQLIINRNVPFVTISNIQYILKYAQAFYQQLNDTAGAVRMYEAARKNYEAMVKRKDLYTVDYTSWLLNDLHFMEYQWHWYKRDYKQAENILHLLFNESKQAEALDYDWAKGQTLSYCLDLAEFFIETKQSDSASRYMEIFQQKNNSYVSEIAMNERSLRLYSELEEGKSNYSKSVTYLKQAYQLKDSITYARMSDITNNLYAQVEAYYNKTELDNAEKQKRRRSLWITVLIITMVTGVLIVYNWFKRKERKEKKRIEQVNITSRLQIAELEDQNRLSKKEEQKRLGIELHDNLASTLAAIKLQLEAETYEAGNTALGQRLTNIKELVATAYDNIRKKSHDLYNHAFVEATNSTFEEMINSMLGKGLSLGKHEKEILIDSEALTLISLNQKIELLYIIQEAVINILKHAKASKISILLYEEIYGAILVIKDNGLGFDISKKKNGIGLNSLAERVKRIDGILHIESGSQGTEISVTLNRYHL